MDGQPADIYRANYAFRAVFVPAGEHRVTFSYEPLDYQIGAALSAAGTIIVALDLAIALVRGRRPRPSPLN